MISITHFNPVAINHQILAGSGREKNIPSSFTKAYQPVVGHRIREQRVNWETDLS